MLVIFLVLASVLLPAPARSDGPTLVPTCIVLGTATDSATVIVHNSGTTAVAWQVDLVRMEWTAGGRLRPVAPGDPAADVVDRAIEVTPRTCILVPGESRTIRLRLAHPLPAAPGEYRSHLVVREMSSLTGAGDADGLRGGAAVPVVLRTGPAAARWRDEQFRAGSTRGAPAIVILDLEPGRPASAT